MNKKRVPALLHLAREKDQHVSKSLQQWGKQYNGVGRKKISFDSWRTAQSTSWVYCRTQPHPPPIFLQKTLVRFHIYILIKPHLLSMLTFPTCKAVKAIYFQKHLFPLV